MVSQTVSEFVAGSRWEDLPDDVRHATKRSLLNFFGTALEGTHDSAVERALATLREFAGSGEATLIGRAERADALTAAFINAVFLRWLVETADGRRRQHRRPEHDPSSRYRP